MPACLDCDFQYGELQGDLPLSYYKSIAAVPLTDGCQTVSSWVIDAHLNSLEFLP